MADKKISQLSAATAINNADLLVIVQGGVTKKILWSEIVSNFLVGSNNLSDVSDIPTALQNLGGLNSTEITSLVNNIIDNDYEEYIMQPSDSSTVQFTGTGINGVKLIRWKNRITLTGNCKVISPPLTVGQVIMTLPVNFRVFAPFTYFSIRQPDGFDTEYLNVYMQPNGQVTHAGAPGNYVNATGGDSMEFGGLSFNA